MVFFFAAQQHLRHPLAHTRVAQQGGAAASAAGRALAEAPVLPAPRAVTGGAPGVLVGRERHVRLVLVRLAHVRRPHQVRRQQAPCAACQGIGYSWARVTAGVRPDSSCRAQSAKRKYQQVCNAACLGLAGFKFRVPGVVLQVR